MTLSLARLGLMGGGESGALEHIQTITGTSYATGAIHFTDVKSSTYRKHLLLFNGGSSNGYNYLSLRFGNSGTYDSADAYIYAGFDNQIIYCSSEKRDTNPALRIGAYCYQGENVACYIYGLGDSSKRTFVTFTFAGVRGNQLGSRTQFGSGQLASTAGFNQIQILNDDYTNRGYYAFQTSLYGIVD